METGETEEICSLLPQNYQAYTSLLHQEDWADLKMYMCINMPYQVSSTYKSLLYVHY